eukprot:TRINITY_DN17676_c0_g1_i1.p1 TRINITY_DN17676_c0_g1~~TRINITY_DN17676_c0_g1_i1.p1  ORF type:complete len:1457 (-),score=244.40 TRINITY_DN17676_c0_g1_i1:234-4604(-)
MEGIQLDVANERTDGPAQNGGQEPKDASAYFSTSSQSSSQPAVEVMAKEGTQGSREPAEQIVGFRLSAWGGITDEIVQQEHMRNPTFAGQIPMGLTESGRKGIVTKAHLGYMSVINQLQPDENGHYTSEELLRGVDLMVEMRTNNSLKTQIEHLEVKGELTEDDKAVLGMLKKLDADGDGTFSGGQIMEIARELNDKRKMVKTLTCFAAALVLMMIMTLLSMFGVSAAVYQLSKETEIDGATMRTVDGSLVSIGEQRSNFPLGTLLYLPRAYRNNLDTITVQLKEKGEEVDLKVLQVESMPSPKGFDGVMRPATRSISCDFSLEAVMYLDSTIKVNSEGVIKSDAFKLAFKEALAAALPMGDIDHSIKIQLSMELEDLGNTVPRPNATTEQMNVAAMQIPKQIVANVQAKFKSLSRAAGTQDGLQSIIGGGDFHSTLKAEILKQGFRLTRHNYTIQEPRTTLLPQLRVRTHSGDELQLIDAGHAQLLRPDGHVEQFCASCTKCASLSVDEATAAKTAEEELRADLSALDRNSGGGRRLEICELCSSDFPQMLSGGGRHVLSRTGPAVFPCSSSIVAMGVELQASTYHLVPNMRAIRWSGQVQQFGEYEYESLSHCIEEAWLHLHACHRNANGEVTVAFIKSGNSIYGHCHCLAPDAVEERVAAESTLTGVYTGKCYPQQAPHVVVPVLFTVVMDSQGSGALSDQSIADFVESTNELFQGDGETGAQDTNIQLVLKGIRRIVHDTFYHQCFDTSIAAAEAFSPDPEVMFHMYSCAGSEYDTDTMETGGWALVGSTRLSRYFMEGRGVGRLAAFFKHTKVDSSGGGIGAHEVGHAFGLKHTWGPQGSGNCALPDAEEHTDLIPDTPPHLLSTDCSNAQSDTCTKEASGHLAPLLRGVDPITNIMSYCPSKNRFTVGQQRRMLEMLQRMRPSLFLRGAFTPRATGCSKTGAVAAGVLVTLKNAASQTVKQLSFLDSLKIKGPRVTTSGCQCDLNNGEHPGRWHEYFAECTYGACCNPQQHNPAEWCYTTGDEVCQGSNWGWCEDLVWTEALELKESLTIAGRLIKKGSKIAAIKIGSGAWSSPSSKTALQTLLSVADASQVPEITIQFTMPSIGDCLWTCADSATCVGVIWNVNTHSCHRLVQAATAASTPGDICYVRERYAEVHCAPASIRLSTADEFPHQHSLITGIYHRQSQLMNGRPVYRAGAGELADIYNVSCLRIDPIYSWWSLVHEDVCNWLNPYEYQYAALASDAPYPTSGNWELRTIYSGDNPHVVDVTIDVIDSSLGLAFCGDGVVNVGEECDDGNLMPLDGCSAQCRVDAIENTVVSFGHISELQVDYATLTYQISYTDRGPGKCLQGAVEPAFEFYPDKTALECAQDCANKATCGGFSSGSVGSSNTNSPSSVPTPQALNCILWLATGLSASSTALNNERCWEKVLTPCYGSQCSVDNFSNTRFQAA